MIELDVSNFSKPYDHLNGNKSQKVTPLDLARAMITIGHGSWYSAFNHNIFRVGELICKALAFSEIVNSNLVLTKGFHRLNQSEKATVSYYFGQGLTKLYSEKHLKVKYLFHVDDYISFINYHTKGSAKSKITIGNSSKNASRPDLIGFVKRNNSHILEAKGNSTGYQKNTMQHAINQVSQIISYNGVTPLTRTACFFDLSNTPIKGIIIDPENDDNGIILEFDEDAAMNKYYSFFIENYQRFTRTINIGKYEYSVAAIGSPNINFGFDKRILELEKYKLLDNDLYPDGIDDLPLSDFENNEFSLGLDGVLLFNEQHKLKI
ncbi:MAG: hypothetical protein IME94_09330 [Proteobacteria bacterium]|nr:hypothetical protein [Pseudomonadota bacterium]